MANPEKAEPTRENVRQSVNEGVVVVADGCEESSNRRVCVNTRYHFECGYSFSKPIRAEQKTEGLSNYFTYLKAT